MPPFQHGSLIGCPPCLSGGAMENTSRPVSRVLLQTAIYLGVSLPERSSHLLGETGPVIFPSTVWLRIEFTAPDTSEPAGELLPHLSTLTCFHGNQAVSLCCTCPEVAFGGCYPLFLPYGARTFLTDGLSACLRGCPACLLFYFIEFLRACQSC